MTKQCSLCKAVKPVDQFSRRRASRDGLMYKCKDCASATYKAWRERNPTKARARTQAWRERNKDRIREKNQLWYERNREKSLEYGRLYRERNPERHVASEARRRAKAGHIAEQDTEYVAILRRDPCSYCGALEAVSHVDHIEPLHGGGASSWQNLTAACRSCNTSKYTSDLLPYLLRASA